MIAFLEGYAGGLCAVGTIAALGFCALRMRMSKFRP